MVLEFVQVPDIPFNENGVKFMVVLGDIFSENTDAIVITTDAQFTFTSQLSSVLLKRGGHAIQRECKRIGTLTNRGAITSAGTGNLFCKHIVHVLYPGTLAECKQATLAAANIASAKRLKSIAFPLIGGNSLRHPQMVSTITDALVISARNGTLGSLVHVRLVGSTESVWSEFDKAMKGSIITRAVKTNSVLTPKSNLMQSKSVLDITAQPVCKPLVATINVTKNLFLSRS